MAKKTDKQPPAEEKTPGKQLTEQKPAGLPAAAAMFEEDAQAGMEHVGARDVAMPFIGLLQQMSPQLDPTSGKYVKGWTAGRLFNTLTNQLLGTEDDPGVLLVPCFYQACLIEWKPRDAGGGLVKVYPDNDPIEKTTKRKENSSTDSLPNGNDLVRTAQHYCLLVNPDGTWDRVMVSLSSTGLKKSRLWNSLATNIKLPRSNGQGFYNPAVFSHVYKLRPVAEKNNRGSFFNVQPELVGPIEKPDLYAAAKEFYELVRSGEITAAPQRDEVAESAGDAGGNLTRPEPGTLDQGRKSVY